MLLRWLNAAAHLALVLLTISGAPADGLAEADEAVADDDAAWCSDARDTSDAGTEGERGVWCETVLTICAAASGSDEASAEAASVITTSVWLVDAAAPLTWRDDAGPSEWEGDDIAGCRCADGVDKEE